jgi:hypothetical protein
MCWMAIGRIRCESGNNGAAEVLHDDDVPGKMRNVALQVGDSNAAGKAKSIVG